MPQNTRSRRTSQPNAPVGVSGPAAAWNFATNHEERSKQRSTVNAGSSRGVGIFGKGVTVGGNVLADRYICNSSQAAVDIGAGEWTGIVTFRYSGPTGAYAAFGRWNTGASPTTCDWYLGANSTFGVATADFVVAVGGASPFVASVAAGWTVGQTYTLIGRRRGTTIYVDRYTHSTRAWASGSTTNAGITTINYNSARKTALGEIAVDPTYNLDATYFQAQTYKRCLLDPEIRSLARNPFQVFTPLPRRPFFGVAGGTTHATSGALTGQGSTVAGTAAHIAKHATTGALTGQGSTIVGAASSKTLRPSTGALVGPGSTVAGTAAHIAKHATTGALTGQGSVIAGAAARVAIHPTTGALVGPGSTIAGVAAHKAIHATSGVLTGPGSVINGQANLGAVSGDTHDGYWRKQWERFKKKPTIAEVVEIVKDKPAAALEVVREATPSLARKYPEVDYTDVLKNVALQRFIAKQLIDIQQQRDDDEDEIEAILMMI